MDLGLGYCNSDKAGMQVFSSRQAVQFVVRYIQRIGLPAQQPLNPGDGSLGALGEVIAGVCWQSVILNSQTRLKECFSQYIIRNHDALCQKIPLKLKNRNTSKMLLRPWNIISTDDF
ncbi:hypothetical protein [Intestinimonas timonensis]|uniref:hypothetical protein n=1 Tax=Intestinimonas timonensis TaxID=1689270 RepID=UPI003A9237D9